MTELEPLAVGLEGTTLIEASAGTGKTYTITTLFVRFLLERELAIGQILVVTYTNAATAELRRKVRERIGAALRAVEQGGDSGDPTMDALAARRGPQRAADRERLRAALLGFDEAAIFTIHGFCRRVLQEQAFESGVAFDTELTTDQTALVDDVVRDFWASRLADAPDALIRALSRRGVTLESLTRLAKTAALHRDVTVLPERCDDADAAHLVAAWHAAVSDAAALWRAERDAIVTRLQAALPGLNKNSYTAGKLATWAASVDRLFTHGAEPPIGGNAGKAIEFLSTARLTSGTNRGQTTPRHPFFDACDRLRAADAALAAALAESALRLQRELVDYARSELRRRKEAANIQFFDDLVHRLADALAGDGPAATALAAQLRERYPAALIDEFQDTDQTQYAIFRRIYHEVPAATLFLIGDPKQSIYAFRGANLFTYLAARADAGPRAHTLSTSWRSDPRYLDAINALFGVTDPFFFPAVGYAPMRAALDRVDRLSPDWPALQVLYMPGAPHRAAGSVFGKDTAKRDAARGAAREIVRMLQAQPLIDGVPVRPHDIAVLCRTNDQAHWMQDALRVRGVHSVLQGDASVFDCAEAADLQRLLAAMADPGDAAALRSALATGILGVDASGLLALQDDEDAWESWAARVQRWHERWVERSFMAAFRRLLEECEVPQRLLASPDGERRMTNLLHLAELLQRAAVEGRRGPLALVEWLAELRLDASRRGDAGDAAQIRLESDESALTLLTIHKAKGLEYPIVFVPFAWDSILLSKDDEKIPLAHDPARDDRLVLDLGSPQHQAHAARALQEARAESLRLLYVALTRARHHCTVLWGPVNKAADAAFGYLIHRPPDAASADAALATTQARLKNGDDDALRHDLHGLANRAAGSIAVGELSLEPIEPYRGDAETGAALRARAVRRYIDLRWRTSSFTALVAAQKRLPIPIEEGIDRDELADDAVDDTMPASPGARAPLDLPGGRRPGLLVHKLLESFDGRQSAAEMRDLTARLLPGYGLDTSWTEPVLAVIDDVLDTPLVGGEAPFRLRDVDPARRLAEVEFMFPVAPAAAPADSAGLDAAALARSFARHAQAGPSSAYAERLRGLPFAPLRGFMHGFIDLVCEHGGRWYVVDYKSNRLGARLADYRPERLAPVMAQDHYILQYHLYVVAVHRYLTRRLPGYDYARHFGGVFYLFVRAMAPRNPAGCGVFYDRPPPALIDALSATLERPQDGGR